jgi:hypothetical protein
MHGEDRAGQAVKLSLLEAKGFFEKIVLFHC